MERAAIALVGDVGVSPHRLRSLTKVQVAYVACTLAFFMLV
ncbi:MAG: hypothetical protein RR365_14750 [Bacteroides sp.]